jgi:hypothetical protein
MVRGSGSSDRLVTFSVIDCKHGRYDGLRHDWAVGGYVMTCVLCCELVPVPGWAWEAGAARQRPPGPTPRFRLVTPSDAG